MFKAHWASFDDLNVTSDLKDENFTVLIESIPINYFRLISV